MENTVLITSKGIKNALERYKEPQVVAELIWNGFDAQASCVEIGYKANTIGSFESFTVFDDGYGIDYNLLAAKFKPLFESEKVIDFEDNRNSSAKHGKNGVGRLTFFKIASKAEWHTIFENNNQLKEYDITIDADAINTYQSTSPVSSKSKHTGTKVELKSIFALHEYSFINEIIPYLKLEFCWFLELNKAHDYKILINGTKLDCSDVIGDREKTVIKHKPSNTFFDIEYIRWNKNLNKEFSKYYYLDQHNKEQWKEYTRLNKKGDNFYHSLFIKSPYFENFNWSSSGSIKQYSIKGVGLRSDPQYEYLQNEIHKYLRDKRSPFLKVYANQLVDSYEKEEIIPKISNDWDKLRIDDLKDTVKGLYEVQPKIFTGMNLEQKKTFVRLLDLILDSDEREKILDIIKEVVELTPEERDQLQELFKVTSLSRITQTIRLLKDRYRAISNLKQLVFNPDLKANEVDHIQEFVENHYWIFGEQYNLVTAAEPDFEEALRRYLYILNGEKKKIKISHPNKNKEMDIFLCRQRYSEGIENVIVELKHPNKSLGKKELDQVEEYMTTILNISQFNDRTAKWSFYLIGKQLNKAKHESKPHIQSKIDSLKNWGEQNLAAIEADMNYKVYVKTWAQIFNEYDLKYKFLDEKLKLKKEALLKEYKTADAIIEDSKNNVAVQPAEIIA